MLFNYNSGDRLGFLQGIALDFCRGLLWIFAGDCFGFLQGIEK